ncbi:MAG: AmmeMemoRadiSam system radical SAM enzyme [Endomicrobiales bacterium]|jgi:pyruvate formate lyase activating enzyme
MKEALLYKKLDHDIVHCALCAHRCVIDPGHAGRCLVRRNDDGILYTSAYGSVVAAHLDPIEKKPLFHFLPGSYSFSFASIGCNFTCSFCQNWQISQVKEAQRLGAQSREMSPEDIVAHAVASGAKSISYTYSEPTIFMEYAFETAQLAKKAGLANVFVTNGYMTTEALDLIAPYLDAANVDLKFSDDKKYIANCGGHLKPVLETIRRLKERSIWVEVTTLIIAGLNDDVPSLMTIASFIADVGKDIPWHVSAFHPDYKLMETPSTSQETLTTAYNIGKKADLSYVYMGNVSVEENTLCHNCKTLLIRRHGFSIEENNLKKGHCPSCATSIPGRFP